MQVGAEVFYLDRVELGSLALLDEPPEQSCEDQGVLQSLVMVDGGWRLSGQDLEETVLSAVHQFGLPSSHVGEGFVTG